MSTSCFVPSTWEVALHTAGAQLSFTRERAKIWIPASPRALSLPVPSLQRGRLTVCRGPGTSGLCCVLSTAENRAVFLPQRRSQVGVQSVRCPHSAHTQRRVEGAVRAHSHRIAKPGPEAVDKFTDANKPPWGVTAEQEAGPGGSCKGSGPHPALGAEEGLSSRGREHAQSTEHFKGSSGWRPGNWL